MTKVTLAGLIIASLTATSAFAAADYTPAVATVPSTTASAGDTAQNFIYKHQANGFVVNDFNFSLSSFVTLGVAESNTAMAVGAASSRGTKVFTGTSNGGSVSSCANIAGATLAASDITGNTTLSTAKKNGCTAATSS